MIIGVEEEVFKDCTLDYTFFTSSLVPLNSSKYKMGTSKVTAIFLAV